VLSHRCSVIKLVLAHQCTILYDTGMARLTISLSDERQRALKEAAASRGRSMGQIIEESLELYGIKTRDEALELLELAGRRANLSDDDAMALALEAQRAVRR